ncbi:MAG: putative metal-dependent HD superfamily phosphohydrolase [Parasphingorhabdus sp.]|jgi:predicted metal-dependent HD superfamily phosphohydrolase
MKEERFSALWTDAGSSRNDNEIQRIFDALDNHYRESHRQYHTAKHISHCLSQLDLIPTEFDGRIAIELAIWFHDAIYEIGDPENEFNSAQWFKTISENDLPDAIRDQVVRLIMSTCHNRAPRRQDEQYTVDIDLSSFGLPWEEFNADSDKVRAEMTHLSDEEFSVSHIGFLKYLLQRERIYSTHFFYKLYESQARQNIQSRLNRLVSQT